MDPMGDDVGDERPREPGGERRREIARLVGVRKKHQRRRRLADDGLERGRVAVGGVLGERRMLHGEDFVHCRDGELLRHAVHVRSEDGDLDRPAGLLRRGDGLPAGAIEHALPLFRDDQNHQITLASSRRRMTRTFAASTADPEIIWVCLPFSGT